MLDLEGLQDQLQAAFLTTLSMCQLSCSLDNWRGGLTLPLKSGLECHIHSVQNGQGPGAVCAVLPTPPEREGIAPSRLLLDACFRQRGGRCRPEAGQQSNPSLEQTGVTDRLRPWG